MKLSLEQVEKIACGLVNVEEINGCFRINRFTDEQMNLYKEYKGDNSIIENLVEEIADVSICMEQMRDFYKDYGVEQVIEKKMEKFKGQIEAMKKQNNE